MILKGLKGILCTFDLGYASTEQDFQCCWLIELCLLKSRHRQAGNVTTKIFLNFVPKSCSRKKRKSLHSESKL